MATRTGQNTLVDILGVVLFAHNVLFCFFPLFYEGNMVSSSRVLVRCCVFHVTSLNPSTDEGELLMLFSSVPS